MSDRDGGTLEAALRARGRRATPQRRLIYEAVRELRHATPEQVCDRIEQVAPGISLSTVYRGLEVLEELGVVTHTHLGHGSPTYHPASDADHIHLVCRRCGRVGEADVTHADGMVGAVVEDTGFVTDVAHLSLHGLCGGCAGDREASARRPR